MVFVKFEGTTPQEHDQEHDDWSQKAERFIASETPLNDTRHKPRSFDESKVDEGQVTPQKALCMFQLISALPCISTSKVLLLLYIWTPIMSFSNQQVLHSIPKIPTNRIRKYKYLHNPFLSQKPNQPPKPREKTHHLTLRHIKTPESACRSSVVDGLEIFHEGQPEAKAATTMGWFPKKWWVFPPI